MATWLALARQRARVRLRFRSVLALILRLVDQLERDVFRPDYIVTIDRNSGVVGSILAGHVGLRAVVSVATMNRRLPDGTRGIALDPASAQVLNALQGKRLLVLICCNDSGTSLSYVVHEVQKLNPPPSEVRTAALYSSPSPIMVPQYCGIVLGNDSRMSMSKVISRLPWMTRRWNHVLSSERLSENAGR